MIVIPTTEPYTVLLKQEKQRAAAGHLAMDAMRSHTARTPANAIIGATIYGTDAVMTVPLARAIVTIVATTSMAAMTAGQATAIKNPAAENIAAMVSVNATMTAATAATLTSLSSISLTSETARFIARASLCGKNASTTQKEHKVDPEHIQDAACPHKM